MFEALVFDSSYWLWALPLPALLAWWFSRAIGAAPQPTGAVDVWRSLAPEAPRAARRSWRWSARVLLTVGALTSALLALAGPRTTPRESPTSWRVVVDASPSMAWQDGGATARGERAIALARRVLAGVLEPGDDVQWQLVSAERVLERASEPDPRWWGAQTARLSLERPRWSAFDEPGVVWVTDRGEELLSRHAGVCASGEAKSEGVIASWPGSHLWGSGEAWTAQPASRAPRVALDVGYRSSAIGRASVAWARARGVDLVEARDPAEVELSIEFAPSTPLARRAAGAREGWRLEGSAAELGSGTPLDETWLADVQERSRLLVRAARGRVECALAVDHVIAGDSAAFVVSWAELLDRVLLPVQVTVPLDALLVRSMPVERAPQRPLDEQRSASQPLAHVFAACAAVLALFAAVVRR